MVGVFDHSQWFEFGGKIILKFAICDLQIAIFAAVEKRLIVIVGPTAVGKTEFSVQLAELLHTEIISADSRQIFKELNIGTAKPSAEQLARVKHHFINSHSIEEDFDAGSFERSALALLAELFQHNDSVILCGGSGLYVRALCEGFDDMPEVAPETRARIVEQYERNGLRWLQQQVSQKDPDYFEEVDQQNPHRLMRALELLETSGQPMATWRRKSSRTRPFSIVKIGLDMEREQLYARIDRRMDDMITAGLFDEAKALYPRRHLNALQTVGYREIFDFLDGQYDRAEAVRLLKRNSRHYAKRQLTWFKKDATIRWFDASDLRKLTADVKDHLGITNT